MDTNIYYPNYNTWIQIFIIPTTTLAYKYLLSQLQHLDINIYYPTTTLGYKYLLSQLQLLCVNVGLYRDDGLAVTNQSPRSVELTKKKICKIFNENGLKITKEANKKKVDFLYITLDITGLHKLHKKLNSNINYKYSQSNHPPFIFKNLPKGIENDSRSTPPMPRFLAKQQRLTTKH